MPSAKDLFVAPISSKDANAIIQRIHYSGKVAPNSQLHLGVFLNHRLEGAMQFGPSLDKRKIQALVSGTSWNGFLELNRMAFSEALPRNSESRAIAIALKMIRKAYPHIDWIISFSDATQCGDGIIYRASGFELCGMRENKTIWKFPDGETIADIGIKTAFDWQLKKFGKRLLGTEALKEAKRLGAKPIEGYQLRYIYFFNKEARKRLTVSMIPFEKIQQVGAGMYKGVRVTKATSEYPSDSGGAVPTHTLQT
jgi:GNAT superfamily N-acetyltransferase